jgi:hypothetical protein
MLGFALGIAALPIALLSTTRLACGRDIYRFQQNIKAEERLIYQSCVISTYDTDSSPVEPLIDLTDTLRSPMGTG